MTIWIRQRTTTTPGPDVAMDCPSCKSQDVTGNSSSVEEQNRFFGIIPFFTSRWVTIQCGSCGKQFQSSRSCEELAGMPREQISAMLAEWSQTHVDFLVKFCVIVGIVVGLMPFLGLIFALIGVAFTYKRRTGWRIAAFVGLALSVISSVFAAVALTMVK